MCLEVCVCVWTSLSLHYAYIIVLKSLELLWSVSNFALSLFFGWMAGLLFQVRSPGHTQLYGAWFLVSGLSLSLWCLTCQGQYLTKILEPTNIGILLQVWVSCTSFFWCSSSSWTGTRWSSWCTGWTLTCVMRRVRQMSWWVSLSVIIIW